MRDPALPSHKLGLRVYYEDTDSGGIVYYANYLRFAERARTEMLREMGFEHGELLATDGLAFAVRRCQVDYLCPAVLDDTLTVVTTVMRVGGASFDLDQVVLRGDAVLADMSVRLACMQVRGPRAGKPTRIPDKIRKALAKTCLQSAA